MQDVSVADVAVPTVGGALSPDLEQFIRAYVRALTHHIPDGAGALESPPALKRALLQVARCHVPELAEEIDRADREVLASRWVEARQTASRSRVSLAPPLRR